MLEKDLPAICHQSNNWKIYIDYIFAVASTSSQQVSKKD